MEYNAKDKYYDLKRSYERLKTVNTDNKVIVDDHVQPGISNIDPKDATTNFFNHCYHFKDWLKKDSSITLTENIEDFINKNKSLSLASDYCNSSKHAGLDRKSRSGQEIEKMNTHINLDLTPKGFVASARLELTIDGKKYDAFSLATDCVKKWSDFLERNQVTFSDP